MQHSNSTAEMFRNITISGSQNGVTFTSLITVTNTSGDRAWVASSVPGSTLWTFLRFQQTSVNSSGNNRFEMGDLLIWGTLSNE
jgi:phage gp46-like protein